MNRYFTIVLLLTLVVPCSSMGQKKEQSNIDVKTHRLIDSVGLAIINQLKREMEFSDNRLLVNSGQSLPSKSIFIDSCLFQIAMDFHANKADTVYWSTRDSHFSTPEGISINTTLGEIRKNHAVALFKNPGWGYYMKLPSNWNLAFCIGPSCTDKEPTNSTKVSWIFKRADHSTAKE